MDGIFSFGDIGLSNAPSLTALLTLAGVSWGMLDLERGDAGAWRRARQLWVPSLGFMSHAVQQRLVDWIAEGGHAVFLPSVPLLDDAMEPCTVLARAIRRYRGAPRAGALRGRAARLGPGPDRGRRLHRGAGRRRAVQPPIRCRRGGMVRGLLRGGAPAPGRSGVSHAPGLPAPVPPRRGCRPVPVRGRPGGRGDGTSRCRRRAAAGHRARACRPRRRPVVRR